MSKKKKTGMRQKTGMIFIGFRLPQEVVDEAKQDYEDYRDTLPRESCFELSDFYRAVFAKGLSAIKQTKAA